MGSALLITLKEGLEAALIVAIVLATSKATTGDVRLKREGLRELLFAHVPWI